MMGNSSILLDPSAIPDSIAGHFQELDATVLEKQDTPWLRLEIPIRSEDVLTWFVNQHNPQKIYWANRERTFEIAGVGAVDELIGHTSADLEKLGCYFKNISPRNEVHFKYFGGIRFDRESKPGSLWAPFGYFRFILPQFELYRQDGRTYFACNLKIRPDIDKNKTWRMVYQDLKRLDFHPKPRLTSISCPLDRRDCPGPARWRTMIDRSLHDFADLNYEKIVLARQSTFQFDRELDPGTLIWRLVQANPNCFHFCFQFEPNSIFMGSPPERLFHRVGQKIMTEAIAGTRLRGTDETEDHRLGAELLSAEKDIREHRHVIDFLQNRLADLCTEYIYDPSVSLLKLNRLQHLYTAFVGQLKTGVDDIQLLKTLHPTPAVGGVPTARALAVIKQLEKFDRGWYAGPVGWISSPAAEFAVAIRTGLMYNDILTLYAGAGIVKGSESNQEWQEIENKMENFLRIITHYREC